MSNNPPSLFAQPAPRVRRRHRRRLHKMAQVPHPSVGRQQRQEIIDLHLRDIWRECFREGCSAAAWQRAGLVDGYLRGERMLIEN